MRNFLTKQWFLVALGLGLAIALTWPTMVQRALRDVPAPLPIAAALLLMAWTMPSRSLVEELRRPWAVLWTVAISYAVVPLLGWLLSMAAPTPDLRLGLILVASVPTTLASCVLWTRLAGGNEATALLTVLASTLTSWLFTTSLLALTTGVAVELDIIGMMRDLVLILAIPVIAGQALRLLPRCAQTADRHKTALGATAQIFILSVILKAAADVGLRWEEGESQLGVDTLLVGAGMTAGLHLATLYFGLWSSAGLGLDRPRCLAVAFAGSQKTLPVALFLYDRYYRADYPLAIVPLLTYHVGQLILDTFIADHLRRQSSIGEPAA